MELGRDRAPGAADPRRPRPPRRPRDDVEGHLPRPGHRLPRSVARRRGAAAQRRRASWRRRSRCGCARPRAASPGRRSGCRASAASGGASGCRCACRRRCCGSRRTRSSTRPQLVLRDRGAIQQVDRRQRRPALGDGQARDALPEQQAHQARRRVDPRGHARTRPRAHRGRHGPDRERPQGPRRQRHAVALPAQRPAARQARPRRDHGLEPGADLAARPQGQRPAAAAAAQARLGDRAPHGDRGPQPPVGDHALGGQRAAGHGRTSARA